jgi:hypothetical protein
LVQVSRSRGRIAKASVACQCVLVDRRPLPPWRTRCYRLGHRRTSRPASIHDGPPDMSAALSTNPLALSTIAERTFEPRPHFVTDCSAYRCRKPITLLNPIFPLNKAGKRCPYMYMCVCTRARGPAFLGAGLLEPRI